MSTRIAAVLLTCLITVAPVAALSSQSADDSGSRALERAILIEDGEHDLETAVQDHLAFISALGLDGADHLEGDEVLHVVAAAVQKLPRSCLVQIEHQLARM